MSPPTWNLEQQLVTSGVWCLFLRRKNWHSQTRNEKGLGPKHNGSKCLHVKGRCCGIFKDLFTRDRFLISMIHASGRNETHHLEAFCSSKNPQLSPETTENPSIVTGKKETHPKLGPHQTSQSSTPRHPDIWCKFSTGSHQLHRQGSMSQ